MEARSAPLTPSSANRRVFRIAVQKSRHHSAPRLTPEHRNHVLNVVSPLPWRPRALRPALQNMLPVTEAAGKDDAPR